ncbi:polypyrimidine tract-binding protein 1-like isoform X3 [Amphiura filiformis]|uniref:polypyrimidine tract-binding protein 1-like isoform X3 n=1 Tax=Amphiura filiformis TaxID=82378 RepID=UPI003B219FEB
MILAPMSDIYGTAPTAFTYATVPAGATTIPGTTYINYIPQTRKRGFVTTESRGSEELLTQTPNGTATNSLSSIPTGGDSPNSNDAKKVKREENTTPSKVLHLRNLPSDCTETEVIQLGLPFGRMSNILMLAGKNQAFIEMQNLAEATAMVNFHNHSVATIRGRHVFLQYSKHTALKTDQAHPHKAVVVQAALAAVNAVLNSASSTGGGSHSDTESLSTIDKNAMAQAALQAAQSMMPLQAGHHQPLSPPVVTDTGGGPNRVLWVTVENMLYPVTLNDLHQVFSRCGTVLKIVTFNKSNQFQALIQYQTEDQARKAIEELNSQNIYNACCTLRITYSKLNNLNVRFNNDKSRDYTRPDLSPGNGLGGLDHALPAGYGGYSQSDSGRGLLDSHSARALSSSDSGSGLLGSSSSSSSSMPGLHGFNPAFQSAASSAQAAAMAALRLPNNFGPTMQGTPVLLVSNLNPELVTPQALFTLFGVYGDVQRVKILFEKRDNALIQMADGMQAQQALQHLNNNVKLYGKTLRVALSKHSMVQLPKEGQPDAGLTKDFTSSPLHRFKKPGSKNFQNIFAPSATLHLSNIPATITEEDLRSAFSEYGTVEGFKFFPKDRKMALIQMGSTEEAVHALIALHNKQLSESNHLRVSFSKSQV